MSLLSKIKKGLKKVAKVATTVNPALGGGFSKVNAMQGQLLTAGMGAAGVSMPGGGNPLATLAGFLGEKVGIPSSLGSSLASSLIPIPGGSVTDDLRAYAAYKIAPTSLINTVMDGYYGEPGTMKKRRRMNPLNARAAKRAIRRIKAVRKITAGIERALPKAKARAWHGHHHHRR